MADKCSRQKNKFRDTRVGHDGLIEEIEHIEHIGAAIEATEIEAQLVLQLGLATRHRASQDRQIWAEHRVVSAFAVHLCPGRQNWFLETERLLRPGMWHFGGKFAPQMALMVAGRHSQDVETSCTPSRRKGEMLTDTFGARQELWASLLIWTVDVDISHRHQEPPTGGRTKTPDATSRVGQRSCLHFCTGCGFEHRSHHQLSKCGENQRIEQPVISQPMAAGSFLWKTRTLVDRHRQRAKQRSKG